MNHLERAVYDLVKANPRLKMRVRDAYQAICDVVPVARHRTAYPIEVRENFFFGFHDKSPWSADDTRLLSHRALIGLRMPRPDDEVEVGYFDEPNGVFNVIARSRAWNWHQGAQLQWVGRSRAMAFNDYDGTRHIARLIDSETKAERRIDLPFGAVSPDGSVALSYSFARLRGSPHGYAYANGVDPDADKLVPEDTGLWRVDVHTGASERLFTVKEVAEIMPEPSMDGAFHYFSHCQFSPNGRRFKFFHRWTLDANRQWTRMFSANLDGTGLHLFPTSGMVSHVGWRDDTHIVAYARTASLGDGYYEFEDFTGQVRPIGRAAFSSDGHPSFSKDGRWMLTDTYADRFRRRFLAVFDLPHEKRYDLAMLYSPKQFAGVSIADHLQCDFHPRWSRNNRRICFDSAHTGTRALCVLDLGEQGLNDLRHL